MNEKKISYLGRTYEDYKNNIIKLTKEFYPDIANNLTDASVGSWLVDMVSVVGDNLSYYIDKAFNETNIDTAARNSSVYSIARSNGLKVPGPKGAITELKFSCFIKPKNDAGIPNDSSRLGVPEFSSAPIIKKGTRVKASNGQFFETDEDLDFSKQFNEDGESNLEITPVTNANGQIEGYRLAKTCTATAGISKIYKMEMTNGIVKPFMEILIPDRGVMGVESIIFKDGSGYSGDPLMSEFMSESEYTDPCNSPTGSSTYRFFEVNSLVDQYKWGDERDANGNNITYQYNVTSKEGVNVPMFSITKGIWKPVTQKFITEYTDNGYLKIIFGSGTQIGQDVDFSQGKNFTQRRITKMMRNDFLGRLPKDGTTMYILYRVGGGAVSNVAAGSIRTISSLDVEYQVGTDKNVTSDVTQSIKVENTIPSVSGKDAPTADEIKMLIKYNNAAQNRCVTIKDYIDRIYQMPARYGCPFRVSAIEENNKIMVYILLCDHEGKLSSILPTAMMRNIVNYLSEYKTINDFVEIKAANIINVSFDVDAYISKSYNAKAVMSNIRSVIMNYMDINKHGLGEDIYVSDLMREISDVDGVINVFDLRVYNEIGYDYGIEISQPTLDITESSEYDIVKDSERREIDLDASDYILNSDVDQMFEVKYPEKDIRIRVKIR